MDIQVIKVGISEIRTSTRPHRLKTIGLGSCVGLVLFDETEGVAGLAHIMLPSGWRTNKNKDFPLGKYADIAVPYLVNKLGWLGSSRQLKAKLVGGAQMFKFQRNTGPSIGSRNAAAVKEQLAIYNIQLVAEEVGGNHGRTIEFNTVDYSLMVTAVNCQSKLI